MRNGLKRFFSTMLILAMTASSIPVSAYGVTTQADVLNGITDSNFSPVIDPGREIELIASRPSQSERSLVDFSRHDIASIGSESQDSVFTAGEPSSPEDREIGETAGNDRILGDNLEVSEDRTDSVEIIETPAMEETVTEKSKGATIPGTKVTFVLNGTKVTFKGSGTIPEGWLAGYTNTIETVVITESVVIGDYAFALMDKISTVTISSSGTSIGERAFVGCNALNNISIPAKITNVKTAAFAECENLASVTMTSSTKTIGDYAFYGCKNLKTVTMPGVQTLGNEVFENCMSLESVTMSAVQTLGNGVFANCTSLESFSLPNTLTKTGGDTFNGCKNLKSVTLSSALTEIGDGDFYICTSLSSISIPNSVTKLGMAAFYGCSALKTVSFPDSYVTVGAYCFSFCNNLEPSDQTVRLGSVGEEAFFGTKLLRHIVFSPDSAGAGDQAFVNNSSLETVDFNGGQKAIGRYAFFQCDSIISFTNMPAFTFVGEAAFHECKVITDVTIADSCEDIMPGAFYYCENLTSVNFSGAAASVGHRAFAGCTSLSSITGQQNLSALDDYCFGLCEKLTGISGFDSLTRIGSGVFYGCTGIKTAVLPEGLKEISDYSFFGCESLKTISLPNSLTKIGAYSFTMCSSLPSVSIPYAVSEIGEAAFAECDSMTSASLPSLLSRIEGMVFAQCDNLGSISGGGGVNSVGERAFSFCTNLYSTAFSASLREVGSIAFYGCENLQSLGNTSGVASIGDRAFYGCAALTEFNASGASSVGEYAFTNCTSLVNVNLTGLSDSLGDCAFWGCESLQEVRIGGDLQKIGDEAFCNCTSLTTISLPNQVISIGDCAFYGCGSLSSFSFPSGLEALGKGVFYNCTNLVSADIPDSVTKIGCSCFRGCGALSSAHLPENLEIIEDGLFFECASLPYVSIPGKLTFIGYASFYGCSALEEVSFQGSVKEIDAFAFAFCESLSQIQLPSSLVSLGDAAFSNCIALGSITLPRGLSSIESGMFYKCSSLTDVYLLGMIVGIGTSAFQGCSCLDNVSLSGGVPLVIGENAFEDVPDTMVLKYSPFYEGWTSPQWEGPDGKYYRTQELQADMSGTIGEISWSYNMDAGALVFSGSGEMEDFSTVYDLPWYDFREGITMVRIEEGITSISSRAFSGCTALHSVKMPDSVEQIGAYAFSECTSLEYIRFSAVLNSIGENAFYGCSGLAELSLPVSLTEIGSYAFFGCSGLASVSLPDSVTSLGDGAFYQCSGLSEVVLSSEIESIGDCTFRGCGSLETLIATGQVNEIGRYAFANCINLSCAVIMGDQTSVGEAAFYGCGNLEKLYFGQIPPSVERNAFKNVNAGAVLYSMGGNTGSSSVTDGSGYTISCTAASPEKQGSCGGNASWSYYGTPGLLVIEGRGTVSDSEDGDSPWASVSDSVRVVSVSNGITSIGKNAFYGCRSLRQASLPEGLQSIGEASFADCVSLRHIKLPDTVTEMGSSVFYHCTSLSGISLPGNLMAVPDYAFALCESLGSVSMGTGLQSIGYSSFYDCEELAFVELPSGLTQVGGWAFARCGNLEIVEGSSAIRQMGDHAFYSCENLSSFEYSNTLEEIPAYAFAGTALSRTSLSPSIKKIGDHAFWGSALKELNLGRTNEIGEAAFYATGLESVAIPVSVKQVDPYAFGNCAALSEIVVDGGNKSFKSEGGVLYNSDKKQLIQYPSGRAGTDFLIPDGVEEVGKGAFYACPLSSIVFPDTVKSIGEATFSRCSKLESVVFSEQVSKIPVGCFAECPALKEVRFPSSLREIWDDAFYQCAMLTDAFFTGDAPTKIGKDAFFGASEAFTISYAKNMSGWTAGKWTGPDGVTYTTKAVDAKPDRYQVTLHTNGGTINSGDITAYTYGIGGSLPTDVTKKGYTFSGWYSTPGLSGNPVESISIRDKGNLDFYAKWENEKYTVTLNTNGGTINSGNITGYIYGTGQSLPDDVTRENYTFAGWYDNAEFTGNRISRIQATETGNLEFFAKWVGNTYNVTLHTNGGTIQSGAINGYTYGNEVLLPIDIHRSGYRFTGWYSDPEMGGEPVTVIDSASKGDLEFYAGWVKRTADGEIRIIRQDFYPETDRIRCEISVEKDTPVPDGEGVMLYAASYSPDGKLMAVSSKEIHIEEESYTTGFSVAGGSIVAGRTRFKVFLLSKKDSAPMLPELTVTSSYSLNGSTGCDIVIGEDPDISASEDAESVETDSSSTIVSEPAEEGIASDEGEKIEVNDDEEEAGEEAEKAASVEDAAESDADEQEVKGNAKAGTAVTGDQISVEVGMDSESFRKILTSAQAGRTSGFELSFRIECGDAQSQEQLSSNVDIPGFDGRYGYQPSGIAIQAYPDGDEISNGQRTWMPAEYALMRVSSRNRTLVNTESDGMTKAVVSASVSGNNASEILFDSEKLLAVSPVSDSSIPEEAVFEKLSEDRYGLLLPYGSCSAMFEFETRQLAQAILRTDAAKKLFGEDQDVTENIREFLFSFHLDGMGGDGNLFQIKVTTEGAEGAVSDVELLQAGHLDVEIPEFNFEDIILDESTEPSEGAPLSVSDISPKKGGAGNVTVKVTGTSIEAGAEAVLKDGSREYKAVRQYYYGPDKLYATFDLSNAVNGNYDLVLRQRGEEATLQKCFEIDSSLAKGKLEQISSVNRDKVKKAKKNKEYSGTIKFTNTGFTDVYAPVVFISATNVKLKGQDEESFSTQKTVFVPNKEGIPGILSKDQTAVYEFKYVKTKSSFSFNLYLFKDSKKTIKDIPKLTEGSSPSDYMLYNLYQMTGEKACDWAESIARSACVLSSMGDENFDIEYLRNAFVPSSTGTLIGSTLYESTDIVSKDLSLSRYYCTDISSHQKEGLFGKGWFSEYDMTAESKDDIITISAPRGAAIYYKQDGEFKEAVYGNSTAEISGGIITVHNQDGTTIRFNSSGKMERITDTYGNYVSLSYGGEGKPDKISGSNGDSLLLSYEGGQLSQVQSSVTGQSVSYRHSDDLLLSFAGQYDTEQYEYDTSSLDCRKNALTGINFGQRVREEISYDKYGRIIGIDNGENHVDYAYPDMNVLEVTDVNGEVVRMFFNSSGQVARMIDAEGMVLENSYADRLLVDKVSYGGAGMASMEYDDKHNITKVTDADGLSTRFSYDALGNITGVTDRGGLGTSYQRNSAGDVQKIVYEDGKYESYAYDDKGNVVSFTRRDGKTVNYTYNQYSQLERVEYPEGEYTEYFYDDRGNVVQISEYYNEFSYLTTLTYTSRGDLHSVEYEYPGGVVRRLSYSYDPYGNVTCMHVDNNSTNADYVYEYDEMNRLTKVFIGKSKSVLVAAYQYYPDGSIKRQDNYNGTYSEYEYEHGLLSSIKNRKPNGDTLSFFEYEYDKMGNIISMNEKTGKWSYSYDKQGQLTKAVSPGGETTTYSYDASGNRTAKVSGGKTTSYTSNVMNQYTTYGSAKCSYDDNGNLISRQDQNGTTKYYYDHRNRLEKVEEPDGRISQYYYDAFGNRNAVSVLEAGAENAETTEYINSPLGYGQTVMSMQDDVLSFYIPGLGLAARLDFSTNSNTNQLYAFSYNHLGSVSEITDEEGKVVNSYVYDQEGKVISSTDSGSSTEYPRIKDNPFTYVGRYGIADDGNGLIYDRARYILADTMSFTQMDPAGQSSDLHLYRYVGNRFINNIDVTGKDGIDVTPGSGKNGSGQFRNPFSRQMKWIVDRIKQTITDVSIFGQRKQQSFEVKLSLDEVQGAITEAENNYIDDLNKNISNLEKEVNAFEKNNKGLSKKGLKPGNFFKNIFSRSNILFIVFGMLSSAAIAEDELTIKKLSGIDSLSERQINEICKRVMNKVEPDYKIAYDSESDRTIVINGKKYSFKSFQLWYAGYSGQYPQKYEDIAGDFKEKTKIDVKDKKEGDCINDSSMFINKVELQISYKVLAPNE